MLLPGLAAPKLDIVMHLLVASSASHGLERRLAGATGKWDDKKPMLGVPEGGNTCRLAVAGA